MTSDFFVSADYYQLSRGRIPTPYYVVHICDTFVIGVFTEITTKLPSQDLQDTVHIVYFYVV